VQPPRQHHQLGDMLGAGWQGNIALNSIAVPIFAINFFAYDEQAGLASTSLDGDAQKVTYGYE